MVRKLFFVALLLTLVALLTPGNEVLLFKQWVYSWLPLSRELSQVNLSGGADKWVHAGLFAVMGFLAVRGWQMPAHRAWLLLGLVGLGFCTEWLQLYIPQRGADWADVVTDVLGVAMGATLALQRLWVCGFVGRGAG
jgi:VanZ family protein